MDRWSEVEYVVVCQVVDGIPAYEVKDKAGNVKTVHHNLVAAPVRQKETMIHQKS